MDNVQPGPVPVSHSRVPLGATMEPDPPISTTFTTPWVPVWPPLKQPARLLASMPHPAGCAKGHGGWIHSTITCPSPSQLGDLYHAPPSAAQPTLWVVQGGTHRLGPSSLPCKKNGWPSAFFHFLNACGWIAKRPPGPRCPVSTLRDRQLQRGRCRGSSCEPIHSPQGSPTCPFFPFFPLFSLAYRAHPPFSRRHPKVGFSLPCTLGGGAPVRTSESSPDRFPHPVPLQATPKKADGHP